MIKNIDGKIYSPKEFSMEVLERVGEELIPQTNKETIAKSHPFYIHKGYIKLKTTACCYVSEYKYENDLLIIPGVYKYHVLISIEKEEKEVIKWYEIEFKAMAFNDEQLMLYNMYPVTSNHEIVELELCIQQAE